MKFSEWIDNNFGYDAKEVFKNLDSLLSQYDNYLKEKQNEPTNDFLIGLGFKKTLNYYELQICDRELILDLTDKGCSITDFVDEINLPFPNTEQAVLNLISVLQN